MGLVDHLYSNVEFFAPGYLNCHFAALLISCLSVSIPEWTDFVYSRANPKHTFRIPYRKVSEGILMALVVMDAGHGGNNPGAVYNGRQEKDDALALALAAGRILEQNGVDVYYTRTTDVYESPYQRAMEGNAAGADYFVSIHRNSSPYPNQYTGIETLVYNRYGEAARLARNINEQLVRVGYEDQGVNERTNLVVLNRTDMPAVLVEVGFINTDADNLLLDERFDETARAIADGILETIRTV